MSPLFAAPPWADNIPLLAIIGAMAAYVGAIRLWYHKARTDAIDNFQKEQFEAPHKVRHLPSRYKETVLWLRGLIVLDVVVIVGAVALFCYTFHDYLPRFRPRPGYFMDGFSFAVQVMWFALLAMAAAHVASWVGVYFLKETLIPNDPRPAIKETTTARKERIETERKAVRERTKRVLFCAVLVVLALFFGIPQILFLLGW